MKANELTLLTLDLLTIIDTMYGEDPTISMVHVAKELRVQDLARVTRWTIANAIKQLGMRSYVRFVSIYLSCNMPNE